MNISNNVSSLQTQQQSLNTSARNIANSSQKNPADLSKEIPNQIVAQNVSEVNVTAIKAQDEMLGSLLDIKA